ncbi:hypothetical protein J6590_017995 [Homalodisca vitripennis]|nr:hypothetical protein J6590_017995 [Homalodisca vitripennis]
MEQWTSKHNIVSNRTDYVSVIMRDATQHQLDCRPNNSSIIVNCAVEVTVLRHSCCLCTRAMTHNSLRATPLQSRENTIVICNKYHATPIRSADNID